MTLLMKTRTLNRLLQKAAGHALNFKEMAEVLKDTIETNVFVISRKGKLLGFASTNELDGGLGSDSLSEEGRIPEELNQLLLRFEETSANADEKLREFFAHKLITIIPIIGGGERQGTLVLSRTNVPFGDDDLILAEYGSTIVGMEILRERSDELEVESRSRAAVSVAVSSLSFSELEAVEHIFDELKGKEGLLVASKIADRVGITRSVIVNALRKLESAGVIETRSLGMKGTYIKILNEQLVKELDKSRV